MADKVRGVKGHSVSGPTVNDPIRVMMRLTSETRGFRLTSFLAKVELGGIVILWKVGGLVAHLFGLGGSDLLIGII